MSSFGNEKQEAYARQLATRAGYPGLEQAIAAHTGRPMVRLDVTPFGKQQASEIITKLENDLGIHRPARVAAVDASTSATDTAPPRPKPRYLTARHLRRIACREEPVPSELDDDAKWILGALARLGAIEFMLRRIPPTLPLAVNQDGPIRTSHLVDFFGSEAAAAAVFGVTEPTFKKWGELVPTSHADRAEVVTNGYVMVPRAVG